MFDSYFFTVSIFPGTSLTSPSGQCMEGFYCVSGADRSNPLLLNGTQCPLDTVHPIIGDQCPEGHYCPFGTDFPIGCPAGTYQDLTNQASCKPCQEGFYCYSNTSDYTSNVCPSGYYCPENTTDPFEFPCPPGTFNNVTGQQGVQGCLPCLAGSYCQGFGNSAPTDLCSQGWYCPNGSSSATVRATGFLTKKTTNKY